MLEARKQQIYSELSAKTQQELLDLLMIKIEECDEQKARLADNEKVMTRMAADLAREKAGFQEKIKTLTAENEEFKRQNEHLTSIMNLRGKDLYGRRSEKADALYHEAPGEDPLSEDEELPEEIPEPEQTGPEEGSAAKSVKSTSVSTTPSVKKDRRQGHPGEHKNAGRRPMDLSHLPHRIRYDFDLKRIQELDRMYGKGNWAVKFWRHHSKVERTRPVTCVEETYEPIIAHGDTNELTALPYPDDILPGSILSVSLATSLFYGKFALGLPFDRQIRDLATDGLFLTEQTVTGWAEKISFDYLQPVSDYMASCLKSRPYNQCDETTMMLVRRDDGTPGKVYVWVHVTSEMDEGPAVSVFSFGPGRSRAHLKKFYGKNSRVRCITCDAYGAYPAFAADMKKKKGVVIVISGCWMHCRRRWANSLTLINTKKMTAEQVDSLPESRALKLIGAIYAAEDRLRTLTPSQRLTQRKEKVKPLVDAYFDYVRSFDVHDRSLGEKLRDAVSYSLKHEEELRLFLTDGRIPIDDGFTERQIRAFGTGRRGWLFNYTPRGAKAAMNFYTVIGTARLNGANPYIYLKFLLEEMPKQAPFFKDKKALRNVMPWSTKYRDYEKAELARSMERYLPPDDERPVSPKKIGKRKRNAA